MKTLGLILLFLFSFGVIFITKEQSKPKIVKVKEANTQQECSTSNNPEEHIGCCISSGRGAYILNQSSEN